MCSKGFQGWMFKNGSIQDFEVGARAPATRLEIPNPKSSPPKPETLKPEDCLLGTSEHGGTELKLWRFADGDRCKV